MKNGIGSWRQIGTTLPHPGENVKETLPILVHDKHLMRRIAVKEETLAEKGEIPVKKEENNNDHVGKF